LDWLELDTFVPFNIAIATSWNLDLLSHTVQMVVCKNNDGHDQHSA